MRNVAAPVAQFFVVLLLSLAATCADAQAQKTYRLGMLERTSIATNAANVNGFREGLRELGYVEGKNYVIEYRSAEGRDERFPSLAAELARLKVDLMVTRGTPATLAAKNASNMIPVIITGAGDPVAQGIVASLSHPGGNLTGLSPMVTEVYPKRVELLKTLVPSATRIVGIFNMSNQAAAAQWKEVERAAQSFGLQARLLDVRQAGDLAPAFDTARMQRVDAVLVGLDTLTLANQALIVDLAAKNRLPAVYSSGEFVEGLLSYGVNYADIYRRAARYADRILKGAKPADLPMEQPTKFELVINLKAARAIGLAVPQSLLLQADRVLQ